MKGKTSRAGLAGASSRYPARVPASTAAKPGDPRDDGNSFRQPTFCPAQSTAPGELALLSSHTLWSSPQLFSLRRLRWGPDLPPAIWGNKISSRGRKTHYINPVYINTSRLCSVYHVEPALGSIEKGKRRRKRNISYTDPSAPRTAVFGVSFLQRLPQQMPEMSRCPNGTECSHTEQGSEENNLLPSSPHQLRRRVIPAINSRPGVPGTVVRSPRRAAPVPGCPSLLRGDTGVVHGGEGTP